MIADQPQTSVPASLGLFPVSMVGDHSSPGVTQFPPATCRQNTGGTHLTTPGDRHYSAMLEFRIRSLWSPPAGGMVTVNVTGDCSRKLMRVSVGITACWPRVAALTPVPAAPPASPPMAAPLPPPASAPMIAPKAAPPPAFSGGVLAAAGAFLAEGVGHQRDFPAPRGEFGEFDAQQRRPFEVCRLAGVDDAAHHGRPAGNGNDALGAEIAGQRAVKHVIGLRGLGVEGFRDADGDDGAGRKRDLLDHRLGRGGAEAEAPAAAVGARLRRPAAAEAREPGQAALPGPILVVAMAPVLRLVSTLRLPRSGRGRRRDLKFLSRRRWGRGCGLLPGLDGEVVHHRSDARDSAAVVSGQGARGLVGHGSAEAGNAVHRRSPGYSGRRERLSPLILA